MSTLLKVTIVAKKGLSESFLLYFIGVFEKIKGEHCNRM